MTEHGEADLCPLPLLLSAPRGPAQTHPPTGSDVSFIVVVPSLARASCTGQTGLPHAEIKVVVHKFINYSLNTTSGKPQLKGLSASDVLCAELSAGNGYLLSS